MVTESNFWVAYLNKLMYNIKHKASFPYNECVHTMKYHAEHIKEGRLGL